MIEPKRIVPRVIDANESSQLFTAAHLILSVTTPVEHIDSLAVMPGLGEHGRITTVIKAWESDANARYLLITGTNPNEATQLQLSLERLQEGPFGLQRTGNVLTQISAMHTRQQTDWVAEQIKERGITSLALYVSHWHMPRAYCSLIKSMLNAGVRIPIFPVAIGSSPSQIVPELNETVATMSAGEAQRIQKYQNIGQIASFAELTDYLDWLWGQDVVKIENI